MNETNERQLLKLTISIIPKCEFFFSRNNKKNENKCHLKSNEKWKKAVSENFCFSISQLTYLGYKMGERTAPSIPQN